LQERPLVFLAALLLFLALFSFFFALFTIPFPGGAVGFYRMTPLSSFDYFYIIFSSVMSALIVVLTFHRLRLKPLNPSKLSGQKSGFYARLASGLGMVAGVFGAVCPACLGINFLALGNVFTAQLSFLVPYIVWVQVGGITFLLVGLYFVTKSSYEKKCVSCSLGVVRQTGAAQKTSIAPKKILPTALVVAALGLLIFQVSFAFSSDIFRTGQKENLVVGKDGKTINLNAELEEAVAAVTPAEGFTIPAKWNGVVSKMVQEGVLDPVKLENTLKKRYAQEMKPEWRAILNGENANLEINADNAVFMMYLLWTLAKHNNNPILFDSPFAKYFKNYDIGVGRAGYGDIELLPLTPEQQQITREVAENSNRPCCNNSTARPDCSHGFAALGLVELMASQGFSQEEIFEAFVKFNSFWFPETYVKNALYFKITQGKEWTEVDKRVVAGEAYSSLSGAFRVKNYLKENFGI